MHLSCNDARELTPREVGNRQLRLLSRADGTGVYLWDIHVNAERTGLRNSKQKSAAGGYQSARIHIAQRDHSIEGSPDHAVALHLLQTGHDGLGRGGAAALDDNGFLKRLHGANF